MRKQSQEERVMEYFLTHKEYPPPGAEYIHEQVFGDKTPLTSTRRALSNLAKQGVVKKARYIVTSDWGRPIHTWELKGD